MLSSDLDKYQMVVTSNTFESLGRNICYYECADEKIHMCRELRMLLHSLGKPQIAFLSCSGMYVNGWRQNVQV